MPAWFPQDQRRHPKVGDEQVELDIAIQRVLLRAEDCLRTAHTRMSREGNTGISMMLAEARVAFGDARESLLEPRAPNTVPPSCHLGVSAAVPPPFSPRIQTCQC